MPSDKFLLAIYSVLKPSFVFKSINYNLKYGSEAFLVVYSFKLEKSYLFWLSLKCSILALCGLSILYHDIVVKLLCQNIRKIVLFDKRERIKTR